MVHRFAVLVWCGLLWGQAPAPLVNPLLSSGPDPWVIYRDGFYYFMHTTGNGLTIWKTRNIEDLARAEKKVVWRAPETGPYSRDVWAPELHFLRGKWYIYFAADAGRNASHRIWVLENDASDPLSGEWQMKGKAADATDRWAIDATVFEEGSRLFMIWSGWEGEVNGAQNIYIAELADPWTVKGARVKISTPEYPWEQVGDLKPRRDPDENPGTNLLDPLHVDVNEGPEILRHGNRLFVIYSAGGCWTDYYSLGMLTAEAGSDLLNPGRGRKVRCRCSGSRRRPGLTGRGTEVFSGRRTGRRTGCCTTPIRSRGRDAAAGGRRGRSGSAGSRTARRISGGRWGGRAVAGPSGEGSGRRKRQAGVESVTNADKRV